MSGLHPPRQHRERGEPLPLPGFQRTSYGKPIIGTTPDHLYAYGDLIRKTELLLLKLFSNGLLSGTTHTCLGQELCQMAVVRALDNTDDAVLSNHRNHGHFLTYSGEFLGLLAEVMGRQSGVCGGRGGSQHLAYRHFHSNGVQGGMTGIGAGLALARKLRESDGIVVTIIGDGTLGEGLLYESLNLSSIWQLPILFVVENNGVAQTTETLYTTGGGIESRGSAFGLAVWRFDDSAPDFSISVENVVKSVRSTRRPGFLVIDTQRMGPHSKGDDLRSSDIIAAIHQRDPLRRLGEALSPGVRHEIDARNDAFLGRLITAAESSPHARFDSVPRHIFGPNVDRPASAPNISPVGKVRTSLNESLRQMLRDSDRTIILGEDIHDPYGGAFKVTAGLQADYPLRVMPTPISEAGIVGVGIGLALGGFRPLVEIMFADFVALAMDQLYNHAVKFQATLPELEVPLVVRTPAGGRRGYGPTHSQTPESMFVSVPGLTVVYCSPRHDCGQLLRHATLNWPYPVLFLEHKLLYGETQDLRDYEVIEPHDIASHLFPTLVHRHPGADLTIVAYGGMVPIVEAVAEKLYIQEELAVQVVVVCLLSPLPRYGLLSVLKETKRVVIVEEGCTDFGIGAEITACLSEARYTGVTARIGAPPVPIPAARSLECDILPDLDRIVAEILKLF